MLWSVSDLDQQSLSGEDGRAGVRALRGLPLEFVQHHAEDNWPARAAGPGRAYFHEDNVVFVYRVRQDNIRADNRQPRRREGTERAVPDFDSEIYELLQSRCGRTGELNSITGRVRLSDCVAIHGRADRVTDVRFRARKCGDHVQNSDSGRADEVLEVAEYIQVYLEPTALRREFHLKGPPADQVLLAAG